MKLQKMLYIAGLAVMTVMLGTGYQVYGMEDPPSDGEIQGPELWGVVINDCQAPYYTAIRVKRIVDCDVQTQTMVYPAFIGCPDPGNNIEDAKEPLYRRFGDYKDKLFGIEGTPIITKVKNFKRETYNYTLPSPGSGDVVTFDAQIKFWVPPPTP